MQYAFGPFTLSSGGLLRGSEAVRLTPTPLGVLRELVAHSPTPVPYPRLATAGWVHGAPSRECIARAIHQIRRALDRQEAGTARWVESVRARGYRFVPNARVTVAPSGTVGVPIAGRGTDGAIARRLCAEAETLVAVQPDRLADAASLYRRALSLGPGMPLARRGLAECGLWAALAEGHPPAVDATIASLVVALRGAPSDARARACLALATAVAGQGSLAEEHAQRALSLDDSDCVVVWYAGLVALCTGDHERGADLVATAAWLEPSRMRLRRHWLAIDAARQSGRRGLALLQFLDARA